MVKTSRLWWRAAATVMVCLYGGEVSLAQPGSGGYQEADGIAVYLGVVPAAVVAGHHPGEALHADVRLGPDAHHLLVALFHEGSGERLENAKVEARVTPLGRGGISRVLEAMTVGGVVTYGNYFALRADTPYYRIDVSIIPGPDQPPVEVTFEHEHRR